MDVLLKIFGIIWTILMVIFSWLGELFASPVFQGVMLFLIFLASPQMRK